MDNRTTLRSPPHFDHAFVTVDAKTLQSINECRFLADENFGRFLVRESESSLLGRYRPTRVFGENTLVEIFLESFGEAEEFKDFTAGAILSFDYPGEALLARKRLEDQGIRFSGELVKRIRRTPSGERELLPWYLFTRPDMGQGSPVALFLHELTPEYLAGIGARMGENGCQDRAAHFEAALKKPHSADYLMRDIVGVTLRLRRERVNSVAAVLTTLGYERAEAGGAVRLRGPDAEITMFADESPLEGSLELKIRLSRPEPGVRFDFSRASSLVLSPGGPNDTHAVWSFLPRKSVA